VATLLAGDRVLITVVGHLHNQRIMMTFPYLCDEVGASIQQSDAFAALRDQLCVAGGFMDKLKAVLPNNFEDLALWFQVIAPVRYSKYTLSSTATGAFNDVNAQTPNLAAVVTRRADRAGRKYRGSVHIPLPTSADLFSGGVLDTGYKTLVQQFANKVDDAIHTATPLINLTPSLFHKPLSVDPTPIVEAFAQDTVRVMRRRTVGLGE